MSRGAFYQRGPAEVKRLLIESLQEHFAEHPLYSDPDGGGILILNHYSTQERRKRQLVIRTASASPQRLSLSADFGGKVVSAVVLGRLEGQRGASLQWVIENPFQEVRPRPGIYLVEVDTENSFLVFPFFVVDHELLFPFVDRADGDKIKAVLKNRPVEPLSEMLVVDEHIPLERGEDYTIDDDTGIVTFKFPLTDARMIAAEYRWVGESNGPFPVRRVTYNIDALPGLVLAFGRKVEVGSRQPVVVMPRPEHVADFHTGRWTISVDIGIFTQDPQEQDELAEEVAQVMWYWNTERWVDQGMAISDPPQIGGGSVSDEDEVTGEKTFENSVTFTAVVDWEGFIPCLRRLRFVNVHGFTTGVFETPLRAVKKEMDARPDGEFGNIIDRHTLPGKGINVVPDLRQYFSGPDDPKLNQLYQELLAFDSIESSQALGSFYGQVDPANPDAPDRPINLPERIPLSQFTASPETTGPPEGSGVFVENEEILSLDNLPHPLREELRDITRGSIRGFPLGPRPEDEGC